MTKIKLNQLYKQKEFKTIKETNKYGHKTTYIYRGPYLKPLIKINNKPIKTKFPIKYIILINNPVQQTYELKITDKHNKDYIYLNLQTHDLEDITIDYTEYTPYNTHKKEK